MLADRYGEGDGQNFEKIVLAPDGVVILPHGLEQARLVCQTLVALQLGVDLVARERARDLLLTPLRPEEVDHLEVRRAFDAVDPGVPGPLLEDLPHQRMVVPGVVGVVLVGGADGQRDRLLRLVLVRQRRALVLRGLRIVKWVLLQAERLVVDFRPLPALRRVTPVDNLDRRVGVATLARVLCIARKLQVHDGV